ncbi:MAG: UvrD-helicase domain-containing protein [Gammaproteobacteria bacterium]|nr:UvrD-helicase domain-containing protein [Gammaproteobacteria bacterium]
MLQDSEIRQQAVSPDDSYIVQAPAGSGKTELLTRRFVRLLSLVQSPEQVIALTFTRKAASEMRSRIMSTLEACQASEPPTDERRSLWVDAQRVIEKDKALNWQLFSQPQRLKVMTIDAMCQWLVRALPVEASFVAHAEIDLFPERAYRQAAKACFDHALAHPVLQKSVLSLLQHLDNREDSLLLLWVDLLKIRDQWLPVTYQAHGQSKEVMEHALIQLQLHVVARLLTALPKTIGESLRSFCVCFAHATAGFTPLASWAHVDALTVEQAQALAGLLFTSEDKIRKRADHHVGLKRGQCDDLMYRQLKDESEALFECLREIPAFCDALVMVAKLPHTQYEAGKWEILQALLTVLPLLVAHLKLTFETLNRVDFTEMALVASSVLGSESNPTDLALYLDYAIQHLLVDEFQDTSFTQFSLIKQLIAGWEKGDGRTLFIVGDPMQSIYRFRQAEVGLFLKVKAEGIGQLPLTALSLTSNFRSSPQLVEWVNLHAAAFFSETDDSELGAVRFHHAIAVKAPEEGEGAQAIEVVDALQEAEQIVRWVEALLPSSRAQRGTSISEVEIPRCARDDGVTQYDSIAILVRSRSHLELIIPLLQTNHIAFEGVDLFSIAHLPFMRDLWSLTQALLMPLDRLPWLCVLRSPYVGLSLADLHALALHIPKGSIYFGLSALDGAQVSEDGLARVHFARTVFQRAYAVQDQYALADWLLLIHQELHGLGQALQGNTWRNVEMYLQLVHQFSVENRIEDWDLFETAFKRMFASEDASSSLKIMTIHQSKGLEFDVVILPGLSRQTPKPGQTLLKWMRVLPTQGSEPLWLLSPLKAAEEASDALYDYLYFLDRQKERYESQRLLYVAMTRAKKRVYLCDVESKRGQHGFRKMLDGMVFASPASQTSLRPIVGWALAQQHTTEGDCWAKAQPTLERVPLIRYLEPSVASLIPGQEQPLIPTYSFAKKIGTIAHSWIQWICEHQIQDETQLPWDAIERDLTQTGIGDIEKNEALMMLRDQLGRLFQSDIGRWLIYPHAKAHNEYAFTVFEKEKRATYVVDRLFYCDKMYWIIDFKTGQDARLSETAHREQVERYARYLTPELDAPIQVGVYYLASGKWVAWAPDVARLCT